MMVCRQRDLYDEAWDASPLPELAHETRLHGSAKAVASIQLRFSSSFLVPLINLPAMR